MHHYAKGVGPLNTIGQRHSLCQIGFKIKVLGRSGIYLFITQHVGFRDLFILTDGNLVGAQSGLNRTGTTDISRIG